MKLYFRELGKGKPMIILHGLFGFSDNWQTLATKFSEFFRVILIDFRNHGHSPWSDDFSYDLMVDDLKIKDKTVFWKKNGKKFESKLL